MRGYHEESAEVVTLRALRTAALRVAGVYLIHGFGGPEVNDADTRLELAALAFAETQKPAPRKRSKRTGAA